MEAVPSPRSAPIRVAIVDDDPEFQGALVRAVQVADDMALAGRAATRAQGLALLRGTPADVLLVDLGLPDGSGIDVIQAASRAWPECGIMVSTTFGDETNVMRSIESGATGYLLKDAAPGRMVAEIRSLAAGGSPISPIIARQVLRRFRPALAEPVPAPPVAEQPVDAFGEGPASLSPREREVLDYITKGFTADEIAKLMQLSRYTVLTFVRRIYIKLKVKSKAEAIYEARTHGLLDG